MFVGMTDDVDKKYWSGIIDKWSDGMCFEYRESIYFATHNGQTPLAVLLHHVTQEYDSFKVRTIYSGPVILEVTTQDEVVYELTVKSSTQDCTKANEVFEYPMFDYGRINTMIAKAFIDGGNYVYRND